jgi:hypothetical protein
MFYASTTLGSSNYKGRQGERLRYVNSGAFKSLFLCPQCCRILTGSFYGISLVRGHFCQQAGKRLPTSNMPRPWWPPSEITTI